MVTVAQLQVELQANIGPFQSAMNTANAQMTAFAANARLTTTALSAMAAPANAAATALGRLATPLVAVNAALGAAATGTAALATATTNLAAGAAPAATAVQTVATATRSIATNATAATTGVAGLAGAMGGLGTAAGGAAGPLGAVSGAVRTAGSHAHASTNAFGVFHNTLIVTLATAAQWALAYKAVGAVMDAVRVSIEQATLAPAQLAASYDTSMSRVVALTNTSASQIGILNEHVLQMSTELPISAKKLAEALYFISSSGFQGADALQILDASSKAAAAGLGETKNVADAVTSILVGYQLAGNQAARVTDILTAAVREGKGEATQWANVIGRVIPTASLFGLTIEQATATMATMTLTGLDVSEAATAIRAALLNLVSPSQQAKEVLKEIGLTSEQVRQMIRDRGLIDTFFELEKRVNGNAEALDMLLPNIRGLTGVLAAANDGGKRYNEILKAMENAAGTTDAAFKTMSQTVEFQTGRLVNQAQAVQIAFGAEMKPAIMGALTELNRGFEELLQGNIQGFFDAIGNVATSATTAITGMLDGLTDGLFSGGVNMMQALGQGIVDGAAAFITEAANIVADLLGSFLIGDSPPPAGPLSRIDEGGRNVIAAWAGGLLGGGDAVSAAGSEMARRASQGLREEAAITFDQAAGEIAVTTSEALVQAAGPAFGEAGRSMSEIWLDGLLTADLGPLEDRAGNIREILEMATEAFNMRAPIEGLDELQTIIANLTDQLQLFRELSNEVRFSIDEIRDSYRAQIDPLEDQVKLLTQRVDYAREEQDLRLRLVEIEGKQAEILAEGDPVRQAQLRAQLNELALKRETASLTKRQHDLEESAKEKVSVRKTKDGDKVTKRPGEDISDEMAILDIDRQELAIKTELNKQRNLQAVAEAQARQQTAQMQREQLGLDKDREKVLAEIAALPIRQQIAGLKEEEQDLLRPLNQLAHELRHGTRELELQKQHWELVSRTIAQAKQNAEELNDAANGGRGEREEREGGRGGGGGGGLRDPGGRGSKLPNIAEGIGARIRKQFEEAGADLEAAGARMGEKIREGWTKWWAENGDRLQFVASGALMGAVTGGAAGGAFGPIGTVIGTLIGAGLGAGIADTLYKDEKFWAAVAAIKKALGQIGDSFKEEALPQIQANMSLVGAAVRDATDNDIIPALRRAKTYIENEIIPIWERYGKIVADVSKKQDEDHGLSVESILKAMGKVKEFIEGSGGFKLMWEQLGEAVKLAMELAAVNVSLAKLLIETDLKVIVALINGDFNGAFKDAAIGAQGAMKLIETAVTNMATIVGGMFRNAANAAIENVNALIGAINRIPNSVPIPFIPSLPSGPSVSRPPGVSPGATNSGANSAPYDARGIPEFAVGGVVPGPAGAPLLAIVHGGEYVVPVDALRRAGGGGPHGGAEGGGMDRALFDAGAALVRDFGQAIARALTLDAGGARQQVVRAASELAKDMINAFNTAEQAEWEKFKATLPVLTGTSSILPSQDQINRDLERALIANGGRGPGAYVPSQAKIDEDMRTALEASRRTPPVPQIVVNGHIFSDEAIRALVRGEIAAARNQQTDSGSASFRGVGLR